MNALEIAAGCYDANRPIDWRYLERLDRELSKREKLEWARAQCEPFADSSTSKNKITRAAKILLDYLHID